MSAFRPSRNLLGLVTLAAVLTACSDNPAGPGGSLDANQATQARAAIVEALEVPALYSFYGNPMEGSEFAAPRTAIRDVDGGTRRPAFGAPVNGASLHKALRSTLAEAGLANAAEPGELDAWYINPEVWGNTYVKGQDGMYDVDPNRTDAPDRGVRLALYQRTGPSTFTGTIVGWLEVIDSSTTTSMIGRINILNSTGNAVASFRSTSSEAGTSTVTVSETFSGTMGVAPRVITVADTMSGTRNYDAETSSLRWHSVSKAPFANVAYDLLATGYDDGSNDAADVELSITVGAHTTRIDGAFALGEDEGVTNVYVDNELVAKITYNSATEETEITGPNGGQLSQQTEHYLAAVMMTGFILPNATILHFAVAMMFIVL